MTRTMEDRIVDQLVEPAVFEIEKQGYFVYVASPYNSPNPVERAVRCYIVQSILALVYNDERSHAHCYYSPIAHFHPIAEIGELPKDISFWHAIDRAVIDRCDAVMVLKMRGWEDSEGIAYEIAYAKCTGKPFVLIDVPLSYQEMCVALYMSEHRRNILKNT